MQLFVAAVEQGSILKAAEVENISQPALTRRLRNLESDLRVTLIERTNRGVRPTPDGLLVYERASALVSAARKLRQDMRDQRSHQRHQLWVGVGVGCETLFGHALKLFTERRPDVELGARVDFFDNLVSQMRAGKLDLIFSIDPLGGKVPDFETGYMGELVSSFACRAGHPLLGRDDIDPVTLAAASWAVWDSPAATHYLEANFLRLGHGLPRVTVRTNSCDLMKAAILSTDSIALVPRHVIGVELERGQAALLEGDIFDVFVNRLIITHPGMAQLAQSGRDLIMALRQAVDVHGQPDRFPAGARPGSIEA